MRFFNSALFRAFIAIVAGGLMVQYREQMVTWLTICIGVMFFLSGFVSIISYYVGKKKYAKALLEAERSEFPETQTAIISKPTLPIVGLGSVILGLVLCFMPTQFTDILVYIFAGIIIVGAIGEYASLVTITNAIKDFKSALKNTTTEEVRIPHCGFMYWIIPTLLLLFGIYAILDPVAIKSAPFLFIGIAMIVYGVSEIINAIKFHSVHKKMIREDATPEEIKAIVEEDVTPTEAEIVED